MLKRRLKFVGKVLLALVALFVVFLLVERFRGQIALASYQKELVAKGEKLSPQDFALPALDADNGAPEAIKAIESLTNGTVLPYSYPPRMKLMASGRALVGFRESEWIEAGSFRDGEWVDEKITNRWDQLAADLKANAATLARIRAALEKPTLNNRVDLSEGAKMKFSHLAPAKSLTFWLGSGSQLALHEGRNKDALEWLLPQIGIPRLLAEDRTIIGELVRIAISAIARVDTWEALQASGWTDEDLLSLQRAWEIQRFAPEMARSFETERVVSAGWYDAMRASNEEAYNGLFRWKEAPFDSYDPETKRWVAPELTLQQKAKRFWERHIHSRLWRFVWSHQAELHGLRAIQSLTETGRQAATNKSNLFVEQSIKQWTNDYYSAGFYDRIRQLDHNIKAMPRSVTKAMRGKTDRALTITAIALKRHFLRHKEYPAALDSLVPEFLRAIPTDYMDGKAIKYRRTDATNFLLYSVGEDGRDDGGDLTLPAGSKSKDLWRRRDCVWPAPATPEEVEECRREAIKN